MIALLLYRTIADHLIPWAVTLATRMLARSLNMPEPLVHSTGDYVVAQVTAFEHGVGKSASARSASPACSAPGGADGTEFTPKPNPTMETTMIDASTFLRRALLADAIFSGVAALGFTFGAGAFASMFNLPEALLRETGLFLIAYAALVGWLASRASVARPLVLLVVVGNAAWTVGSIALLFSGAVSPNIGGELMVVAQAIATGVFAELQYVGLRKSGSVVAA